MKKWIAGIATAVMTMAGTAALALPITFDPGTNDQSSLVFNIGNGETLIVSAFSDAGPGALLAQGANGLGVVGSPSRGALGANSAVTEAIVLNFSRTVRLDSLLMNEAGNNDSQFTLLDDDDISTTFTILNDSGLNIFNVGAGAGLLGTTFVLFGEEQGSGVRLAGLTAAVPLPAPILLLLGSLAGLGLIARRRSRATA